MPRDSAPVSGSDKKNHQPKPGCLRLFFIPFALVGAVMFYAFTWKPISGIQAARSWEPTDCVISESRVAASSSSDGTTYRVDIRYAYTYRGKRYEAARYDFSLGSSSGRRGKQKIVDRYPPGSTTTCYVNPADPREAVIDRGFNKGLLIGLFPIPFLLIGVLGFIYAPRLAEGKSGHRASRPDSASANALRSDPGAMSVPGGLRSTASHRAKFFGVLVFAIFWNGIISFFVVEVINGFARGKPQWFLAVFMVPFVLIGLGALVAAAYQFLNLFNPRIELTLNRPGGVRLGDRFQVNWTFSGRPSRIRKLNIFLEGVERATYRRGTDTATDRNVFARVPLIETEDAGVIASGSVTAEVPSELMHSFKAHNNEIAWSLKVQGDVPRFPDVSEEFEVTILPKELSAP